MPDSKSPAWILIGRAVSVLLAFVTGPLIARSIGPDGRGETALVVALIYLLPVLGSAGLPFEIRRSWSVGAGEADSRTARLWAIICVIPAALVGGLLYFTLFANFDPAARVMAVIAVVTVPAGVSWMCDNGALIATHRFSGVFVLQVLQPTCSVVGVAGLWALGQASAASVIGVYAGGSVLTCIAGILMVRTGRGRAGLAPLLRRSIPFWGSSAAEAAANRIDQVLALPLMGSGAAGLYSVAVSLGSLPIAFGHALTGSYFSSITRSPNTGVDSPTASLLRESFVVGVVCTVLGFGAVPLFIPLLFGEDFSGSVTPGLLLFAAAPFSLFVFAATQVLGARGRGRRMTILQLIYLAVVTTLFVGLSVSLGVVGAALACTIAALVMSVIAGYMVGVPIRGLVPKLSDFRAAFDSIRKGKK